MSTKIDPKWVAKIREDLKSTALNVDALISEVERLEAYSEGLERKELLLIKAERYLRDGKEQFAPDTTNSRVDDLLSDIERSFRPDLAPKAPGGTP